jgi:pimeloyl-ACP methyl ester carboxylesterase
LLVGGFLTDPGRYQRFGEALRRLSGRPVFVAPIGFPDWMTVSLRDDFTFVLRKLAGAVTSIQRQTGAERITIVGHSVGGVLARLFLGEEPYGPERIVWAGHRRVERLYTLGSPNRSVRGGRRVGLNQVQWVMRHYPEAFWPDVEYISVCGSGIVGRRDGAFYERAAFASYSIFEEGGAHVGDGIIPLSCALLEGSHQIVLPDIHHGPRALRPWYGEDEAAIGRWWVA